MLGGYKVFITERTPSLMGFIPPNDPDSEAAGMNGSSRHSLQSTTVSWLLFDVIHCLVHSVRSNCLFTPGGGSVYFEHPTVSLTFNESSVITRKPFLIWFLSGDDFETKHAIGAISNNCALT